MKPILLFLLGWLAVACPSLQAATTDPAVLFSGSVHNQYLVQPLTKMGIQVDVCPAAELGKRLATGQYNVVVVSTMTDAERQAIEQFLERGGGVFMCNPKWYPREHDFTETCRWLEKLGARERWELLRDADPKNVVRDLMGVNLSFSSNVSAPVNDGVQGVLTLMWPSTTGCEPPMPFDFSSDWNVVVRGAASMKTVPEKRNDLSLQPWLTQAGIDTAPPLMALRAVGKGRLAVMGIRADWIIHPPDNCPTSEVMLTEGAGGKSSNWLRVFANSFRWLAGPSLQAGLGGAKTPANLLHPPVSVWAPQPALDWSTMGPIQNQLQTRGLIGARTALSSGTGTVAEYVKAAKASGLQFLVFLEDSLKMDQAKWNQLVTECKAVSDESFAAIPGLTYEDAQGDHLYAFSDQVQFPKPEMLLPDRRLDTAKSIRTKVYFDYVNELMLQKVISGFWNHKSNYVHFADYKLYDSFPIYSFENGRPIDSAFNEYQYLMGIGGCQAVLALELMTSPDQVAQRAQHGWRVVANRPPSTLRTDWYRGALSFSGSGSQYITDGPQILSWEAPFRMAEPHGEFWRPDLWEYRVRLRVASDVGLKSVTIYDGEQIFQRWLPQGAKTFEQELVLANAQQRGLYPVVEDVNGHKAIGMEFWNRNLNMEEFFCSDRCNFLGNCRLRTRDGRQVWTQVSFRGNMGITPSKGELMLRAAPAVNLTMGSPTLPVDGAPAGLKTVEFNLLPWVPGEYRFLFSYPTTYLVGPEIAVGQGNYILAYDPAELNAKKTPLGHDYIQPQVGYGNAWGSWHHLIPTKKVSGWTRIYACNWLPEQFRLGWVESNLELKEAVKFETGKGIPVLGQGHKNWILYQNDKVIATPDSDTASGRFTRGTFAILADPGGSAVVFAMDDQLTWHYSKGGSLSLSYQPENATLPKETRIHYRIGFAGAAAGTSTERMLTFARMYGITTPGKPGYQTKILTGKQLDNYVVWQLDGKGQGIEAKVSRADLPGYLPVSVEGLNDNWSVQLLDKSRPWPNHRALPIRDGRAFAQLDLVPEASDIFIGHPVTCNQPDAKILVSWEQPGRWRVQVNNPTDRRLKVKLDSNKFWSVFKFHQQADLAPGTSQTWQVPVEK